MLGAIAGDIIGSVYEWQRTKTTDFPLFSPDSTFTDDTVLTIAVAQSILSGKSYRECVIDFATRYPNRGYGGFFRQWIKAGDLEPYNSFGNGSAMRVSPVGFAFDTESRVLEEAKKSAKITHSHPEGIKGAQATALAVFLARTGSAKDDIWREIKDRFGYDLERRLNYIRTIYTFDETCQGTVPEALIAFFEADDYESAVRNAVSLGGDSDTLACIAGGIAEAFYKGVPTVIRDSTLARLPEEFVDIVERFESRFR